MVWEGISIASSERAIVMLLVNVDVGVAYESRRSSASVPGCLGDLSRLKCR